MGQDHIRRLLQNLNDDDAVQAGLEAVRKANADAYEKALKILTASQADRSNKRSK